MAEVNDAQAIIEAARDGVEPHVVAEVGGALAVTMPNTVTIETVDMSPWAPTPARRQGLVSLGTGASLERYVADQRIPGTVLYADESQRRIVAVIDDHEATNPPGPADDHGQAGWGEHRATLTLQHSPEWKHWASLDGKLVGQEAFAEHIQEGIDDILEPDAAQLLELAQTFRATTKGTFGSSKMLDSGQVQFTYHEELKATGGEKSNITIPARIGVGVPVFDGADTADRLDARFRFRLRDGELLLGYKLQRPHLVVRQAWQDVIAGLERGLDVAVLWGSPRPAG